MMRATTALLGAMLALGQTAGPPSKARPTIQPIGERTPTPEIRIDSGALRGLVVGDKKDVHAYKGIPYAAAPVGELRWKPPQPARPWTGVRDCFAFGAACPQKSLGLFSNIPEVAINAPFHEDCLFLNVWTPAGRKADKLPVLYWIHGGGFIMGAASQPVYDGQELARLGCVVVSINYRLGLFGFLAHPALSRESADKVSGNYGLLDQVEGLRWVKRNIAAFGGDPDRVAIAGESAGGCSALCLMAAPQARGLFHAAIAQSPVLNLMHLRQAPTGQESAEQAGVRMIAACGADASADARQLRHLDVKALVETAPGEAPPGSPVHLKPGLVRVGPVVDGHVIPDDLNRLFAAGREHAVPLIIGTTREEMTLLLLGSRMPADEAAYLKKLTDEFGDLAGPIAKAYPTHNPAQVRPAVIQLTSDLSFIAGTRWTARAHAAAGQKTYRYQFSRGTKRGFLQSLGAHHGADFAFLFQRPAARDDESERRISRTLGLYWINFAATGDPNGKGLPAWPAYGKDKEEMIDFAEGVNVLKGPRNDQLDVAEKALGASVKAADKSDK